jgi:hypothetical protein
VILRRQDEHYAIFSSAIVAPGFEGEKKEKRVSKTSSEVFKFRVPEPAPFYEDKPLYLVVDAFTSKIHLSN